MIIQGIASGGKIVRGYNAFDDFVASPSPRTRIVSAGSSPASTNIHDANVTQSTLATTASEFDVAVAINLSARSQNYTLSNLTTSVISLSGNSATRLMNGTAIVQVQTMQGNRNISYAVSQQAGQTTNVFNNFISGWLARAAANAIDTAITGKTPSSTTQNFFSSGTTRNASLFAGLDLTCVAQGGNATAITPVHVIEAAHDPFGTFTFIGSDGSVNSRTVVHSDGSAAQSNGDGAQIKIAGTDIAIMRLNSALPASVTPAKLLPANIRNYLPAATFGSGITCGVPVLFTNQFRTLCVGELTSIGGNGFNYNYVNNPLVTSRQSWYSSPIVGDSGSPTFLWLGGTTAALVTCWTSANSGPIESDNIAAINSAISTLGGGVYTVSTLDLSAYSHT